MKLRDRRRFNTPDLMIIPMIDIMFFLLVFFMLSTLYMVEQRSLPVRLPVAESAQTDSQRNFAVTMRKDGRLYLEDKEAQLSGLLQQARLELRDNPQMAVIVRADRELDYGRVINLIDQFKRVGIGRFGLAVERAGSGD